MKYVFAVLAVLWLVGCKPEAPKVVKSGDPAIDRGFADMDKTVVDMQKQAAKLEEMKRAQPEEDRLVKELDAASADWDRADHAHDEKAKAAAVARMKVINSKMEALSRKLGIDTTPARIPKALVPKSSERRTPEYIVTPKF